MLIGLNLTGDTAIAIHHKLQEIFGNPDTTPRFFEGCISILLRGVINVKLSLRAFKGMDNSVSEFVNHDRVKNGVSQYLARPFGRFDLQQLKVK